MCIPLQYYEEVNDVTYNQRNVSLRTLRMTRQRLADRRAATQKMQGGIIERLGGDVWRQESTAEVRDKANVRFLTLVHRTEVLGFRLLSGKARRCCLRMVQKQYSQSRISSAEQVPFCTARQKS